MNNSRTSIHHNVVIVGAGQAGISVAARLRRDGVDDIAIIDAQTVHSYRPLLSYVGGGQARLSQLRRPQRSVIPRGVRWYAQQVVEVEPTSLTVHTDRGLDIRGDDLILCPGLRPDWDSVPGSEEAVRSGHGCSNYGDLPDSAAHTWQQISRLRAGRAVFSVAAGPVPCAGAALKPLFLAAEYWRRTRVLDDIAVTALIGWDSVFGIDRIDEELHRAAERYGIEVRTGNDLTAVDPDGRRITVHDRGPAGSARAGDEPSGRVSNLDYDLLHLVPVHRGHRWVVDSGLAPDGAVPATSASVPAGTAACYAVQTEVAGMIDVDPQTLAHRTYPGIWGLGDAAAVAASRSGGALRKQAAVVAVNLQHRRRRKPQLTYNGYSTAPITVSRGRLVLAEFDRRLELDPSIPLLDLSRTRRLTWIYDRFLQPFLYWHSILKGRIKP